MVFCIFASFVLGTAFAFEVACFVWSIMMMSVKTARMKRMR
jgi:hypothetical protein